MSRIATISLIDPVEIIRNLLNSASDFFIDPSAKLSRTEVAALQGCGANSNCSCLGNFRLSAYMLLINSLISR